MKKEIDRTWFYVTFSILFLVKAYFLYCFSISEDELSYLRYSSNLTMGYIPFRDFFEIYPPLFHIILAPFVVFYRNQSACVFQIRLVLLVYTHIGLYFYYLILKRLFPKQIARIATLFFSASFLYFIQCMEIRRLHLSLPTFLILYYCFTGRQFTFLRSVVVGFLLFAMTIVDHRFIFITGFLFFLLYHYRVNFRVVVLACFIGCSVASVFFLYKYDREVMEALINIFVNISSKKDIEKPFETAKLFGDWTFFVFSLYGLKVMMKFKKYSSYIVPSKVFMAYYIISIFICNRPYSIYPYGYPFIALWAGMGIFELFRQSEFKNLGVGWRKWFPFIVLFVISANLLLGVIRDKNEYGIPLDQEIEMIDRINTEIQNGGVVLNLSSYPFDLYGRLISPYPIQIDSDLDDFLKKSNLQDLFYRRLKELMERTMPDLIIFTTTDSHFPFEIRLFIEMNYLKQGTCLYRRKSKTPLKPRKASFWKNVRKTNRMLCREFINRCSLIGKIN